MAHSANIISKVKLPGSNIEYQIHDAEAVHSAADLGLGAALVFKGTKATKTELPSTENKAGDVWHVTADDYEYVWNGSAWEELGAPHDFASSSHVHNIETLIGVNEASKVTAKAVINGIETKAQYAKINTTGNGAPTDVLGVNASFRGSVTPTKQGLIINQTKNAEVTSGGTERVIKMTNLTNPLCTGVSVSTDDITTLESVGTLPALTMNVTTAGVLTFDFNPGSLPTSGSATVVTKATPSSEPFDEYFAADTTEVLTGVAIKTQPEFSIATTNESAENVNVITGIESVSITIDDNDKVAAITALPQIKLVASESETDVFTGHEVTVTPTTIDIEGIAEAQAWSMTMGTTDVPIDSQD